MMISNMIQYISLLNSNVSNIWFGHRIDVGNVRWIKNSFRFKEMHLFTVEQRIR